LKRRGSVILLLLFLSVVVAMLATALFKLHIQSIHQLGMRRERQQALQWARAGLNHAVHRWTYTPGWATDLDTVNQGQGYRLTFSLSPYRCVNNLANPAASATLNYRGELVPAHSADVVVEGVSGRAVVRLHALVQHGVHFQRSLGALGKVLMDGDCEVRGIRSFADPSESGGGILSKHELASSGDWAINHSGSGALVVGTTAMFESLPQDGGLQAIAPSLYAAAPDSIRENSSDTPLPEFDVPELVSAHTGDPAPPGMVSGSLPTTLLNDSRYVSSDLTVNGDLVFSANGALYVAGDLTLNGGVIGEGAIYCNGNVQINGGSSSLITNQGNGAALFAAGDVNLQGQSAVGYLDALASAHPAISIRWTAVRNDLTNIKAALDTAPDPQVNLSAAQTRAQALWSLNWGMSKRELSSSHPEYSAGVTPGQNWINSIPSPNGSYADAGSGANLPALVDEIRNSLGGAYASDIRAQRIVHALEETHYYFRHNNDTAVLASGATIVNNRLVGSGTASVGWDDSLLNPANWSFEHGVIEAGAFGTPDVDRMRNFFAGLRAFYDSHPMDFSWMGSSNFQGILYGSGNVTISNQFDVTGLVLSGGQVQLSGGSRLVYNEEYVRQGGATGPLRCHFVYEI